MYGRYSITLEELHSEKVDETRSDGLNVREITKKKEFKSKIAYRST